MHNGRDVALDAVDLLKLRLREPGASQLEEEVAMTNTGMAAGSTVGGEPLKRRLAQVSSKSLRVNV
jgi:hypothetical protein